MTCINMLLNYHCTIWILRLEKTFYTFNIRESEWHSPIDLINSKSICLWIGMLILMWNVLPQLYANYVNYVTHLIQLYLKETNWNSSLIYYVPNSYAMFCSVFLVFVEFSYFFLQLYVHVYFSCINVTWL